MSPLKGISRYLLLIICISVVSVCFLFLPLPQKQTVPNSGYDYYRTLTGSADGNNAADMLEPDQYISELPQVRQCRYSDLIEAESLPLPPHTGLLTKRNGYSGEGYVGALPANTESAFTFPVHVPQTQHYQITLCAAASKKGTYALRVNGELFTQFSVPSGSFTRITFYGLFLERGSSKISVDTMENTLELDYLEISDDTSLSENDYVSEAELSDPQASPNAQRLYAFLRENWGRHTLIGQYVSDPRNRELDMIARMTGRLPAIRFSVLGGNIDREQIEAAIDWNVYMDGVVGLMWQWNAPGSNSIYTDETDFDLHSAFRNKDPYKIAMLTPEQAERAAEAGTLPQEALLLLRGIDDMADTLRPMTNMDIPVLWRPLHEAGGGWYWWGGAGKNDYIKLWKLLYYRMTEYHGLHNLIWVWNGQSAAYLVPNDCYDIASADIYLQPQMEYGSRYEQFVSLQQITGGRKLLALSECSALPDPEMMQLDHAVWSFFGQWYGEYLMNPDGTFCDSYYSSNDLYNLYNSKLCLSLNDFLSLYQ